MKYMANTEVMIKSQAMAIKNLETQMGQMASILNNRPQGSLPSTTETNPRREGKEKCQAITLRSGKKVTKNEHGAAAPYLQREDAWQREAETESEKKENHEGFELQLEEDNKAGSVEKPVSKIPLVHPLVPFPQRLNKKMEAKQFS